ARGASYSSTSAQRREGNDLRGPLERAVRDVRDGDAVEKAVDAARELRPDRRHAAPLGVRADVARAGVARADFVDERAAESAEEIADGDRLGLPRETEPAVHAAQGRDESGAP